MFSLVTFLFVDGVDELTDDEDGEGLASIFLFFDETFAHFQADLAGESGVFYARPT